MITVYWLIGAAALLLLEIATVSLTSIWFAGGALAAAIVSALGATPLLQAAVFIVISVILLVLTRPVAVKFINTKVEKTNADALIGRECKVLVKIDPGAGTGNIMVNDVEWKARPLDGESVIEAGEKVIVREISGVKLLVEKAD